MTHATLKHVIVFAAGWVSASGGEFADGWSFRQLLRKNNSNVIPSDSVSNKKEGEDVGSLKLAGESFMENSAEEKKKLFQKASKSDAFVHNVFKFLDEQDIRRMQTVSKHWYHDKVPQVFANSTVNAPPVLCFPPSQGPAEADTWKWNEHQRSSRVRENGIQIRRFHPIQWNSNSMEVARIQRAVANDSEKFTPEELEGSIVCKYHRKKRPAVDCRADNSSTVRAYVSGCPGQTTLQALRQTREYLRWDDPKEYISWDGLERGLFNREQLAREGFVSDKHRQWQMLGQRMRWQSLSERGSDAFTEDFSLRELFEYVNRAGLVINRALLDSTKLYDRDCTPLVKSVIKRIKPIEDIAEFIDLIKGYLGDHVDLFPLFDVLWANGKLPNVDMQTLQKELHKLTPAQKENVLAWANSMVEKKGWFNFNGFPSLFNRN